MAIYEAITLHSVMADLDAVYIGMAAEAAPKPYVLAQLATSQDFTCQDVNRMGATFQYLIEVYANGESFPHDLAAEVDEALQGYKSVISTDYNVVIHRVRPTALADQYNGREIRRSGGIYRVTVT
jgi:hypothetical protein